MGLISANALNRPIIFQLATKKVTSPVALRNGLEWVWVKPTGTRTIFFLTTRLKIVRYACYPQNRGDSERFGNEKFSSHQMRTERLRAS